MTPSRPGALFRDSTEKNGVPRRCFRGTPLDYAGNGESRHRWYSKSRSYRLTRSPS